jgi:hypothetical protein
MLDWTYTVAQHRKVLIFTGEVNDDFKKAMLISTTTNYYYSQIYNLIQINSIHTQLTKDL